MPRKDIIKYFPFSPGIPWKLKNGRYVVPQIAREVWDSVLADKDFVVLAHNGFLESFWSLSIIEALGKLEPNRGLFWAGNRHFKILVWSQGIAKTLDTPDLCDQYPIPLFFDREKLAYFNCLNNYRTTRTYSGNYEKPNRDIIFHQIFRNSMIPWKTQYIPVLRNNDINNKYKKWLDSVRFHDNQRFILIIPEQTVYSRHIHSCLGWEALQIREFAAMVRKYNLPVIVCTDNDGLYYNSHIIRAPIDLEIIIPLLSKTWMILSEQIDYLLVSMVLSNANIISKPQEREFDLYKHAEYLDAENVIFTTDDLSPLEVYTICEGL